DVTMNPQDAPVQQVNVQNLQQVPAPAPQAAPTPIQEKTEIVQPIPNADPDDEDFDSLSEAVAAQDAPASLDSELNCLAVSVY
ncbi:hypothetical protein, partial [Klebsiella aerogenes]